MYFSYNVIASVSLIRGSDTILAPISVMALSKSVTVPCSAVKPVLVNVLRIESIPPKAFTHSCFTLPVVISLRLVGKLEILNINASSKALRCAVYWSSVITPLSLSLRSCSRFSAYSEPRLLNTVEIGLSLASADLVASSSGISERLPLRLSDILPLLMIWKI